MGRLCRLACLLLAVHLLLAPVLGRRRRSGDSGSERILEVEVDSWRDAGRVDELLRRYRSADVVSESRKLMVVSGSESDMKRLQRDLDRDRIDSTLVDEEKSTEAATTGGGGVGEAIGKLVGGIVGLIGQGKAAKPAPKRRTSRKKKPSRRRSSNNNNSRRKSNFNTGFGRSRD